MKYSDDFIKTIQCLDNSVDTLDDAICYALSNVPSVDYYEWFGEIGDGVYYGNSRESRWFPNMNIQQAAQILVSEML